MMTIYIDSDFKCHPVNDGTMTEIKTDYFKDKCDTFVEGYRFVPADESWTREDGVTFHGEMVAPWRPYEALAAAQAQYEIDQAELLSAYQAELQAAYQEGVNSV